GGERAEARGLRKCTVRGQAHKPVGRGGDVLRKTAIRIIQELADGMRKKAEVALEGGGATEHRLARAAIRTHAAGEPRIDVNTLTRGHVGDLTPDRRDDAGSIEPNARGKRRPGGPQPAAENRLHFGDDARLLSLNQP